jgi:hypothetical protein
MKLEDFRDLIFPSDYKMCETKMEKNLTWYPLTLDIFVKFLYNVNFFLILMPLSSSHMIPNPYTNICILQRRISNVADTAAMHYRGATPEDRRSAIEIWETMTKAQEKLIKHIRTSELQKVHLRCSQG